jgi:hypothetical protein
MRSRSREISARFEPRAIGPGDEILFNGERGEAMAALQHLHETQSDKFTWTCPEDVVARKANLSRGDAPALGLKKIRDRFERGRLAGAVGADQRDDLAAPNGHAHAVQGHDGVMIVRLDVFDGELEVPWHC